MKIYSHSNSLPPLIHIFRLLSCLPYSETTSSHKLLFLNIPYTYIHTVNYVIPQTTSSDPTPGQPCADNKEAKTHTSNPSTTTQTAPTKPIRAFGAVVSAFPSHPSLVGKGPRFDSEIVHFFWCFWLFFFGILGRIGAMTFCLVFGGLSGVVYFGQLGKCVLTDCVAFVLLFTVLGV